MFLWFVNWFAGVVRVLVSGNFPERFLNICAKNGIAFWDVAALDKRRVRASMRVPDYRKLKPFAVRSGCRVHIERKRGLPFLLARLRTRYGVWAGLALLGAAIFYMSSFVWTIEITGYETISPVRVRSALEELGLRPGVYTGILRADELANDLLIRIPELSWAAVNLMGSRAEVRLKERTMPPEMASDEPSNVVAGKAGFIARMDVYRGQAVAQAGNAVLPGELLVSGLVEGPMGSRLVHADADVYAVTWHRVTALTDETIFKKVPTGREKTRHAVVFLGARINLYQKGGNPYDICDKIIREIDIGMGNILLPIRIVKERYVELAVWQGKRSESEISEQALAALRSYVARGCKDGEKMGEEYGINRRAGMAEAKYECMYLENIARTVNIK